MQSYFFEDPFVSGRQKVDDFPNTLLLRSLDVSPKIVEDIIFGQKPALM
jgi:hypothetical protein